MNVIFSGIRGIAFSPLDFILNPILWHDLVVKYRADVTTAPNFSYGLLIKRLLQRKKPFMTWSFINRITSGGEPIDPAVMEQVVSVLAVPRSDIFIGYGLAEVALVIRLAPYFVADGLVGIAGGDGGGEGPSKIRIVNEGKEAVEDGIVGEIYVQSPSQVALGYWGKPEETANTFHNRIEGEEGEWLATGDLGKIVDDKLYVTGRKKELIIINGVNYYPVDIERTVEKAYPAVLRPGCTVAFQHSDGAIGLAAEVRKGVKKEDRPTPLDIVNLITQENRASVGYVCFLREHTVPKTTSRKLKRVEVRKIAIERAWPKGKVLLEWHNPRTDDAKVLFLKDNGDVSGEVDKRCMVPTLGAKYGTQCPFASVGMSTFYNQHGTCPYANGEIVEQATLNYDDIIAELRQMEHRLDKGEIKRHYEASENVMIDNRFWTAVPGFSPKQFGVAQDAAVHKEYLPWLRETFSGWPWMESLRVDIGNYIAEQGNTLSFEDIRGWVLRTMFSMLASKFLSAAEVDEMKKFQSGVWIS